MDALLTSEGAIAVACGGFFILALIGTFVVRALSADEEEENARMVAWKFPPKEDKAARRNRWSRGKGGSKTRPVPLLPTSQPAEVTVDQVLTAFQSKKSRKKQAKKTESTHSPGLWAQMWGSKDASSKVEYEPAPISPVPKKAPEDVEKIKQKILQRLMEVGPPKNLAPIVEEYEEGDDEQEGEEGEEEDRGQGCTAESALLGAERASGRTGGGQCQKVKPPAPTPKTAFHTRSSSFSRKGKIQLGAEWDGEAVMVVGKKPVSREMLWNILAQLGRDLPEPGEELEEPEEPAVLRRSPRHAKMGCFSLKSHALAANNRRFAEMSAA